MGAQNTKILAQSCKVNWYVKKKKKKSYLQRELALASKFFVLTSESRLPFPAILAMNKLKFQREFVDWE